MKKIFIISLLFCSLLFIGIFHTKTVEKSNTVQATTINYKEKIDTLLEEKIFSKLPKEKIEKLSKQLKNIDIQKFKTSLQQEVFAQFFEAFEEKYQKKYGRPTPLNIVADIPDGEIMIPTLMFHYIEDISKNVRDQDRYSLSFSPKRLEELLQYLDKNDIETLDFFDLKNILEGKRKMPKKAIFLTFDDGHINHYENAFPLLKKYNKK